MASRPTAGDTAHGAVRGGAVMYKPIPRKLTNRDVVGRDNDPSNVYKVRVQADGSYKLEINPLAYLTKPYTIEELREAGFKLVV